MLPVPEPMSSSRRRELREYDGTYGLNFASIAKQQLDFGKFNSRHVFFCLTAKVVESNSRLTSDVKIKSTRYPNAFVVVFPQKKEEIFFPTRPQPKSA